MRSVELNEYKVAVSEDFNQHVLPTSEFKIEVEKSKTQEKERLLSYYFTNPHADVSAIRTTMDNVLAASLIARFSRATEFDITELFWQEFVQNSDLGAAIVKDYLENQEGLSGVLAEEKARKMIKRIIDRFGDDSVREQASGYIVVRDHSVLVSEEAFLHPLVTGIEASTRFIEWGDKDADGQYRYTRPESLMASSYRDVYEKSMDQLFDTYGHLWQDVWNFVVAVNPKPDSVSDAAYNMAVRGRVCDNLRKLLPLGIKTNFGLHAKYREFSELVMDLRGSRVGESRLLGDKMARELMNVNPEFLSVVDSDHGSAWTKYKEKIQDIIDELRVSRSEDDLSESEQGVSVFVHNNDWELDLSAGLFAIANPGISQTEARIHADKISTYRLQTILSKLGDARTNRRHKVAEALQGVVLTAQFKGISYGSHKDFNRHRNILFKTPPDWEPCGVYIPDDIAAMGGKVLQTYRQAQEKAYDAFSNIGRVHPSDARRLLTHGMQTSFSVTMGLAQAFWISELRSIASGDPEYRRFAQMLYDQMSTQMPGVKSLKSFVDMNDYSVGRIQEAVRADLKGTS